MTLQEAEVKLSGLNTEIDRLLKERETILKEWNIAFNAENQEGISCIDENIGDCHNLYLVNGDSRMHVCQLNVFDMKCSIEEFYRHIDTSMAILDIANKRDSEIPEYCINLIYAKTVEIREEYTIKNSV